MLLKHLLYIFPQLCLLRQMDRLLDKHSDAFNIFIEQFSTGMTAKGNGSTVGETSLCY